MKQIENNGQILVRYCDATGNVTPEANPNGSLGNIAGICSHGRNVFGLMPHPERVCDALLGGTDGRGIFQSMIDRVASLKPFSSR